MAGSVLDLSFADRSLESVSCLHVAQHVGLGRYGDPLDPDGTKKAAAELERVLAPGGQLLVSLPVGRPRECFNAHRIHAPAAIVEMFGELELFGFAGVGDAGRFAPGRTLDELAGARYAAGCSDSRRPARRSRMHGSDWRRQDARDELPVPREQKAQQQRKPDDPRERRQ